MSYNCSGIWLAAVDRLSAGLSSGLCGRHYNSHFGWRSYIKFMSVAEVNAGITAIPSLVASHGLAT